MIGINVVNQCSCLIVFFKKKGIEEASVCRHTRRALPCSANHFGGNIQRGAVFVPEKRLAPVFFGVLNASVPFNDPRFPVLIERFPLVRSELGLPGKIISEDGIIFTQAVHFNELFDELPLEVHGCSRAQRQIGFHAQTVHAPKKIKEVMSLQRFMVNKNAQCIAAHGDAAFKVPLDNTGVIGIGTKPLLKIGSILHADARRRHIVDPVGNPALPIQIKAPFPGSNKTRRSRRAPEVEHVMRFVQYFTFLKQPYTDLNRHVSSLQSHERRLDCHFLSSRDHCLHVAFFGVKAVFIFYRKFQLNGFVSATSVRYSSAHLYRLILKGCVTVGAAVKQKKRHAHPLNHRTKQFFPGGRNVPARVINGKGCPACSGT